MEFFRPRTSVMVDQEHALKGRGEQILVGPNHLVLKGPVNPVIAGPLKVAMFGMGCFWGAERLFWNVPGVVSTSVGYAGGFTENPTYEEVCSGRTGHAEVVRVIYDSTKVDFNVLLRVFFEGHDPTQQMRQGNDVGTQYRSLVVTFDHDQDRLAHEVAKTFGDRLVAVGFGALATEIISASELATSVPFFFAEDYHQQYLEKNPNGYCGLGGTGVSCPVGLLGESSSI